MEWIAVTKWLTTFMWVMLMAMGSMISSLMVVLQMGQEILAQMQEKPISSLGSSVESLFNQVRL